MIAAPKLPYEERRVNALKSYDILDTTPDQDFDDVTLMATQICDTPIAYISLMDEDTQWFKSSQGAGNILSTPRSESICDTAIKTPNEITIIEDARNDDRFYNNKFVKAPYNLVFYASVPLLTHEGLPIGTICVADKKPRKLTLKQKNALKSLSRQVMVALEIRQNKRQLEQSLKALVYKNAALEGFTDDSVNDMRSPLNTISLISDLTRKKYANSLNEKDTEYLNMIENSTNKVLNMLNNIKEFHDNLDLIIHKRESFFMNELLANVKNQFTRDLNRIKIQTDIVKVFTNKAAINKILSEILANAIERTSEKDDITINFEQIKNNLYFTVTDSGDLLKDNDLNLSKENYWKEKYNLDFLSTVKILIHSLGGTFEIIHLDNKTNVIKFSISK